MTGRRWPIRYQLAAIVLVPLVALAIASVRQTYSALHRAAEADRVESEATFSVSVNTLAHELQRERGLSGGYVGSGYRAGLPEVTAQRVRADDAARAFGEQASAERGDTSRSLVRAALDAAETALRGLPAQRRAIDDQQLDVESTLSFYTEVITKLLAVDRAMAKASDDPETTRISTTLLNLSESKEFAALERGFMNSVFSAGRFRPGNYDRLLSIIAQQDAWFELFRVTADPATLKFYQQHVTGADVDLAANLRTRALTEGAESRDLTVNPTEWWSVMTTKIDLLRDVELHVTEQLREHAATVAREAQAAAARDVSIALGVVGLSLALSVVTARRMARSLRKLRDTALEAADVRLPAVVASLADGKDVDVDKETELVQIHSNDEIGDTANAFNHIHNVAVRLTVDQAGMRRSLSDTLLNLARRSQALIHQQLKLIDELERSESDSATLESLFQLDHLATRMRRHTEDIIVLSGAIPSRGWTAPVPLRDVVRGAIAEVENYSRVKAARLPDVAVVGHAVGDLLHLLAELIENATKFSPPYATVQITAGEVGNGYVIEIEDRGIGMRSSDMIRHNERLADPPAFDLTTSDRLGLYVVGRLAARHSIRVSLRDALLEGMTIAGVTAVVLVGRELLRPMDTIGETGRATTERTPDRLRSVVPLRYRPASLTTAPEPPEPPTPTAAGRQGELPAAGRAASTGGDPAAQGGTTPPKLPRRVPRKNLAATLRRDEPAAVSDPRRLTEPGRDSDQDEEQYQAKPSPEEIRTMLSGYQAGFDRGLVDRSDVENGLSSGHPDTTSSDTTSSDASRPDAGPDGAAGGRHDETDRVAGDDREHEYLVADRILDYPTKPTRRTGQGQP